ncbi:hypothetical protein B0H17DRAFT_1207408 [Mycena rosella]|uniref:F-box domain-containing protein n=1 Tax=Mycena rosella TaxID=1033263 RepID=A0AAD7D2X4_MYCRO|nr:hypothetical protein B0H17DRAFT_1207408 [Mycena rosella]
MPSIPFDILTEILPLLDPGVLAAVARTNKDLSAYALDLIYSHVRCRNMKGACQSIASNPGLAVRVHLLEITPIYHWSTSDVESFLPILRDALRITINLHTLILDIQGGHSWVLKPAIGVITLRSFSCSVYTDQTLLDFLHSQSDLEEIVLQHSFIPYSRSVPWKFPRLKKLNAPMSWVDTIAPHNPVSHVMISEIVSRAAITSLGLTTTSIRQLDIPLHAVHDKPFEELKALFRELEDLTLTMKFNWATRTASAA